MLRFGPSQVAGEAARRTGRAGNLLADTVSGSTTSEVAEILARVDANPIVSRKTLDASAAGCDTGSTAQTMLLHSNWERMSAYLAETDRYDDLTAAFRKGWNNLDWSR